MLNSLFPYSGRKDNAINFVCSRNFFLFFFLLISNIASGQGKIKGTIMDGNNEKIVFANVLLLNPLDSSLIKGGLTDDFGKYTFQNIPPGDYLISASYLGYNIGFSDPFILDNNSTVDVNTIVLLEGVTLDQVQVTARKPLYEQKIDRLVVNVSNSIVSTGGTALEVLERSPGVIVNQQTNAISLIGKEGVVVMINGRINYQPTASIVQMLAGMPSDNIESIELITTPPANYDAEGNAGFINIVLKQRTDLGLNGNVFSSLGYGNGETGSGSINMNYRKGGINIFASYGFTLNDQKNTADIYRRIGTPLSILENNIHTDRDPQQLNNNLRLGADFQLSSQTIFGVLFSAYHNKWTMDADNNSIIKINGMIDQNISLQNEEINRWKHTGANANLEHKFSSGGKLNVNVDYLHYEDYNPNNYDIQYYTADNNLLSAEKLRSSKLTPIDITVGQIDYSNDIHDNLSYSIGLKFGHSSFNNTVSAENNVNGNWIFIDQFTNESDLTENIGAAFGAVDYKLDNNNSFKLGLRYEHTDSQLNTVKEGSVVDRQFGVFFPSVFYSRTINDNQSINLSYSKRITRPTFNDMAPFAIFFDPNTYVFGNAGLQPAITNNVKAEYRYKSYILSLQYAKQDSTIATFQERVDVVNNQQLYEPTNLSNTKTFSASLSLPIYLGNKYSIQNNVILIQSETNSFYENTAIKLSKTVYSFNSTHSYNINNDYTAEISGFYNSPSITGRYVNKEIYGVNVGFQKKFDNGSKLGINIRDLFNSIVFAGGTDLPSQNFLTQTSLDFSNRTFSLSYSFNFGNSKLKSSRSRVTGSEEERSRVN